jgi:protocatechuate 3,4-dioxygenase beta subunit
MHDLSLAPFAGVVTAGLAGCGSSGAMAPGPAASGDAGGAGGPLAPSSAPSDGPLALTPSCKDGDDATLSQTEGPYWKPSSPERASLVEAGAGGRLLTLEGFVVSRVCRPVERALVDLWHCDGAGAYDNAGFRFRGHLLAAADGSYRFQTIVPGLYPGRTRHFHVKVQAPGRPVLTTQLYFPDEPGTPATASTGLSSSCA